LTTAETAQLVADGKGKMELHKIHIDAEFKFTMAYLPMSTNSTQVRKGFD